MATDPVEALPEREWQLGLAVVCLHRAPVMDLGLRRQTQGPHRVPARDLDRLDLHHTMQGPHRVPARDLKRLGLHHMMQGPHRVPARDFERLGL